MMEAATKLNLKTKGIMSKAEIYNTLKQHDNYQIKIKIITIKKQAPFIIKWSIEK